MLSTPAFDNIVVPAFAPQAVDDATVNGITIAVPTQKGRALQFVLTWAVAIAAGQTLDLTFQGQRDDNDAWETIKDKDDNDLIVSLDDTYTDLFAKATLPIQRLGERPTSSEVAYKAYRVNVTEGGLGALTVAGIAQILDLYELAGQDDLVADLLHPRN